MNEKDRYLMDASRAVTRSQFTLHVVQFLIPKPVGWNFTAENVDDGVARVLVGTASSTRTVLTRLSRDPLYMLSYPEKQADSVRRPFVKEESPLWTGFASLIDTIDKL